MKRSIRLRSIRYRKRHEHTSSLDKPLADDLRLIRIRCTLAVAVMLCALRSAAAAQGERHETPRPSLISIFLSLPLPEPRVGNGNPFRTATLAFTVSVCLADVEYSIACKERALAEAVKRLEQIYLDVYVTRRAAGSLKVWFPLATEQSEQLRFLRDAEERAIKTVAAKLLAQGDQGVASPMSSPETNPPEDQIRERTQRVQKWRDDASVEARKGTNWSHDWSSKMHSYQLNLALHELARINNHSQGDN